MLKYINRISVLRHFSKILFDSLFRYFWIMKGIICLTGIIFLCFFVHSQTTYFIKDAVTLEVIPFVKVYPQNGQPFLADIDGAFSLEDEQFPAQLKVYGYVDTLCTLTSIQDNLIFLRPVFQQIQEVKVIAGENPAHRIMDLVIENRKKNHPMENDAFRYKSYSKFFVDANRDAIYAIPDSTTDSTLIEIKKFFNEQYLFMMESASTRTFIPPSRDKEEVTAYKVSGFSDPMFSTFVREMQSFSFYENQVQLLGKDYVNPIALGGTRRYLFLLEDTTVVNNDTTFTIFYRPRKGKNFDGLTGRLYINTNGYAIEKVSAMPCEDTTGVAIKILQEYRFVEGKKWFPEKLSSEVRFKGIVLSPKVKDGYLIGKGVAYIEDVELDPKDLKMKGFDNITVSTASDANLKDDKEWEKLRKYDLNNREVRTYTMIDSLSKANDLDRKLQLLKVIGTGKVPMGKMNLDIARLMDFNQYEGFRLGAGLETSNRLSKLFMIGGYFAYGFKDKALKYGGYSTINLYEPRGLKLQFRYQEDVRERGGTGFQPSVFSFGSDLYRDFYITSMDKERLAEVALKGRLKANINYSIFGAYTRMTFTDSYLFEVDGGDEGNYFMSGTENAEAGIEISWHVREKMMKLGDQLISTGGKGPKIKLRFSKSLPGMFNTQLDYVKMNFQLDQTLSIRAFGKFSYNVQAGKTWGNVPLFLMHNANPTGKPWNLSVSGSFETMPPATFYNDQFVSLFTRLYIKAFKTKALWNEPQISLHHGIGYGELNNKFVHGAQFRSTDKGYFEGGLIINNILVSGFSGIGIGVFYNYGYYSSADWKSNIIPKISLSVTL